MGKSEAEKLFEEHGEEVAQNDVADASPTEIIPESVQSNNKPVDQRLLEGMVRGTEGLLMGGAQGATMDNADELGAAIASGAENLATKGTIITPKYDENYIKYRDLIRKYYSTLEKEQPGPTKLGQGLGSFALPLPSNLVSPALKIAKNSSGLAKFAKTVGKYALPVVEGGLIAGVAKVGHGETPLDTPEGLQKNIEAFKEAAPTGMKFGAGVSALHAVPGLIGLSPGGEEGLEIAKLARRGIELNPQKRGQDLLAALRVAAKPIRKVMKNKGQELETALNNVEREMSPETIDAAIAKIEELKTPSPSGSPKTKKIDANPSFGKDLNTLETILKDFRYGKETEYGALIKGYKKGQELPAGEDVVRGELEKKQTLLNAADVSGQPEEQAVNRLKEKFAKKQMNEGSDSPFSPSKVNDKATGESGFQVYNPEKIDGETGEISSNGTSTELIKNSKPGEIFTIPINGQNVMGFKLKNGKFYGKVVSSEGARTEIIPTEEKLRFTQRADEPNPAPLTPSSLRNIQTQIKDIPYGEATAMKTIPGDSLAREIDAQLRGQLKKEIPEFKKPLEDLAELNTVTDPVDAKKGMTEDQRLNEISDNLFNLLQRAEQDPVANRKALKLMSTIKRIAPVEAEKIIPHIQEKLKQYRLSKRVEKIQTPIAGTQNVKTAAIGAIPSLIAKGGAKFGRMQRKADQMVEWIAGQEKTGARHKVGEIMKKIASEIPERSRNALLFSLMQDPGAREVFNEYNEQTGSDLFNDGEEVEEGK